MNIIELAKKNNLIKELKDIDIIEDNYVINMDYFCLLISSQLDKLKYNTNLFLAKDSKNKLKKDSIIKLNNIHRIENEDILFKVGEVTKEKINMYRDTFIKIYS